ncbi:1-acyl-sn-glycerol-3-phosphate acyltransferase [Streptomyces sp. NBC_01497]|uniref:1-acyl-sn-glycerol-3-phosphate acyltransferase n=1 Tax=Streptomyces sp. NBC_01497 TaxID=2903885 RepID=UPI002E3750CF|nr:1-acyl-sn-glycerol-3-phosphate acyltransferase [Streptomyces sp. NBC_01497]
MKTVRRLVATVLLTALIPLATALLICVTLCTGPVSLARHGRWRAPRIAAFALLYLVVDVSGVVAATAHWLRHPVRASARRGGPGGGGDTAAYTELASVLGVLYRAAVRTFGLDLHITPPLVPARPAPGRGPLLVLARHAGPGDSFLLVHSLLAGAGLRPHIVLKRLLRLDPCLDILLSRVPHCFVPAPRGVATERGMAALAARLGPGDALVLFPEGGNFTARRHRRAIGALRGLGRERQAVRAEAMPHVLAPHTAGVLAVLEAAPTADVVFVAHTGLDRITSARTGWAELPLRESVEAHWWQVPAGRIPAGDEARSDWLFAHWARMDAWIASHAKAA